VNVKTIRDESMATVTTREREEDPASPRTHAPRLYHKKSRTGCQRCKARRVKCDEKRPTCSGCNRHGMPCIYALPRSKGRFDSVGKGTSNSGGSRTRAEQLLRPPSHTPAVRQVPTITVYVAILYVWDRISRRANRRLITAHCLTERLTV